MEHHFNVEVAEQLGVEKAILLYNIDFWIQKNKANEDHFYDGRTWTYNSSRAFAELFPYMKERTIRRRQQELEKDGFLVSSQKYNSTSYDKTKWYSLTEKCYSIGQNSQSSGKNSQSSEQNGQSLNEQIVNTDGNPDNKQGTCVDDEQPKAKDQKPGDKGAAVLSDNGELFERFWSLYPRKVGKQDCRKIWDRLKPSKDLTGQIVTAVRAYKRTEQWQEANGKYIPHPATFLNKARWEDDIPAKPEPQRGDPDWLPTEEEAEQIMRDSGLMK